MDAARLMRDNDTGAIIVTDGGSMRGLVGENGKPVGVISLGDLAMERDEESALADISAASPNN
jgi:CBS domain-containing protein